MGQLHRLSKLTSLFLLDTCLLLLFLLRLPKHLLHLLLPVSLHAFCGAWWGQQWQRFIKGHVRSLARVPMRRVEDLRRLCPPPCHALDHLYFLRPSVLLKLVQLSFLVLFLVVLCRMRSSRPILHAAVPVYPLCPPLVLGPGLLPITHAGPSSSFSWFF